MKELKYWLWLSRIEGLGNIRTKMLLDIYKSPERIWNLKFNEILKIDGFGEKIAKNILENRYRENLDRYIEYTENHNIKCITIYDDIYPEKLRHIYDPPIILYVKGNVKILRENGIAIVGCRDCSNYGKTVARNIACELASKNINVISGLARGIDTQAHIGCIEGGR